jgi:hypothetical protein
LNSSSTLQLITQTFKSQAAAGAAAGVSLGVVRGIVTVRRHQLKDGYDVLAEGVTQVGTGAVLGILCAMTASVTGVTVAAIAGRGILAFALPVVASTITSNVAHGRIDRMIRPLGEDFAQGMKWVIRDLGRLKPVPELERAD